MKFSEMVYYLITNHFCEFQCEIPKDSTQNRIQIDSSFGVICLDWNEIFRNSSLINNKSFLKISARKSKGFYPKQDSN
ncbi:hypothetical protein BLOT_011611 [Blomia tropicalis]|nr:hypothetical protein BLOT_011611 [Blomia tropicalis]